MTFKNPHEPFTLPLELSDENSVLNDIPYISAKHGKLRPDGTVAFPCYGLLPQTGDSQGSSHPQTIARYPPHVLVHADEKYPLGEEKDRGTFGWFYKYVPGHIAAHRNNVTMSVIFVLTPNTTERESNPRAASCTKHRMFVDTGSRTTWLFSTRIPDYKRARGPRSMPITYYQATDGEVGRPRQGWSDEDKNEYQTKYLDGTHLKYRLHNDFVELRSDVPVNGQYFKKWVTIQFGAATSIDEGLETVMYDGVLGLRPDQWDTYKHMTFMNSLIRERDIGYPEITIYVGAPTLYKDDPKSILAFGLVLSFTGMPEPLWKEVTTHGGDWTIVCPQKVVNNRRFPTPERLMVIDSGCSGIWLPLDIVTEIYEGIRGAEKHQETGIWTFPKPQHFGSLPLIKIQMGNAGGFLELHRGAIIGHDVPDNKGYVEGTIQTPRSTEEIDLMGLAGMKCMWVKYKYGTAQWQRLNQPYPPGTENNAFSWAPKTTTSLTR